MMHYEPFSLSIALDKFLGSPEEQKSDFSFARCLALDACEAFPADICARLDTWGLARYYVPEQFGGALRDFDQPHALIRTIGRRDLTVAIGHGKTFLGVVCAWLAAAPEEARALASRVMQGAVVSWGLTEREHGSDLLANELRAEPDGDGWRLFGEKWLINNATRGQLLSVLVKTRPEGDARGYDMMMVDKQSIDNRTFKYLPKENTLGIRGADISGIAFDGTRIPGNALLGVRGEGLEIVLKGLQLTRTLCTALSLGAAEHGLRTAMQFASTRSLYGRTLWDLPEARRTLLDAYADQLLAEAMSLVAVRSIQALPADMSVTSAVVKYLVPTRTEATLDALGSLLGARAFLADGMFQKVQRDNRIVSLFDGNTLVNLNALINAFPSIARNSGKTPDVTACRTAFDLVGPLPAFRRDALTLVARSGCAIVNALPLLVAELAARAVQESALQPAVTLAKRIASRASAWHHSISRIAPVRVRVPVESFELARCYTLFFAASAAIGVWLHTSRSGAEEGIADQLWRDAVWLRAVLGRIADALGEPPAFDEDMRAALWCVLKQQFSENHAFSIMECPWTRTEDSR